MVTAGPESENVIEIELRLFGAFRDYQSELCLRVPKGTTVAQLKTIVGGILNARHADFRHQALLADSAIGSPRQVLADSTPLTETCELAVLPPVCGG